MRAYTAFLRLPYAARLLAGTLLGRLPNGMGALAIVLHLRDEGAGYPLAGALAAVFGLATAAGQPVLGRAMDRLGQPRVLTVSAWAAGAGFGLIALLGTQPMVVAAVVLAGFATPPLEAGLRALWPMVLNGPARVRAAYALDAASQELLFTAGPLIVVAAAMHSTETALWLTGALGIAGTMVVTSSRPSREWRGEPRATDWAGPLRSSGMRTLVAVLACAGIALGVYGVAVVAYAERAGNDAASGLLLAAMSAGALTGGLIYGARPWSGQDHQRLPYLLGALALGYLPLMAAPALPFMLALAFLSGIFLAPALACSFTMVDGLAPRGTVTEAFAWIVSAVGAGAALGSAMAGLGQDIGDVPGAFAGAGTGGLLALTICLLARRTLRPGAVTETRERAPVSPGLT